jgi:hypothetical protein
LIEGRASAGGTLASAREASYALEVAASAELIGRDRELQALSDRLDRAAAGEGGLVLVAGEAGVGKTSLVQTAVNDCALLLLPRVVSDQGMTPYAPIVTALRAYDRIAPGALARSGHLSGHLAALLPEIGPAPGIVDRLALSAALRDAFVGMAGRQPTVVFLDDLHWGDEATLELLPSLAESAEDCPLLFLAAHQSDDVARGILCVACARGFAGAADWRSWL